MLDQLIIEFDRALRTVTLPQRSARPHPDAHLPEAELSAQERQHVAALMRINHCGEVCAQALYRGQAISSRNPASTEALQHAAEEETEHLAWCEQRISAMGGRKSVLNPLWYAGSFALGVAAGWAGNRWNMGFLQETERQVGAHLQTHLRELPAQDEKTRAILQQMDIDEARHADTAKQYGAEELPKPVKAAMRLASKVMTRTAYYL